MSLVKSYSVKLVKTALNAVMAAFIWPFIASSETAASYGDFGYLQNLYLRIFTVLEQFVAALYPRVASNKVRSYGDQIFSVIASTIFSVVVLSCTFFLFSSSLSQKLFFDISFRLIILVFLFCYCQVQSKIIIGIADSLGLTWKFEPVCIGFLLALLSVVLYLLYSNNLNLENFLTASIITNLSVIFYGIFLVRAFSLEKSNLSSKKIDLKKLFLIYLKYSGPIYFATIFGILLSVSERYLVQAFNGPAAQGYLTFILNISLIISMISAVMTPFILRTIAENYFGNRASSRQPHIIQWFDSSLILFLQISVFISVWLALNIDRIIELIGWDLNEEFRVSFWLVLTGSTFRVVNQFCSSSLLGSGKVKDFAICSVSAEAVSLIVVLVGLVLSPAAENWVVFVAARLVFNELVSACLLAGRARRHLGFVTNPWMLVIRTLSFAGVVFLAITFTKGFLGSGSVLILLCEIFLSFSCAIIMCSLVGICKFQDLKVMIR